MKDSVSSYWLQQTSNMRYPDKIQVSSISTSSHLIVCNSCIKRDLSLLGLQLKHINIKTIKNMTFYGDIVQQGQSQNQITLFDQIFGTSPVFVPKMIIHWPCCRLFKTTGTWSTLQNYRYLQFIKDNFNLFQEDWGFRKNTRLCCRMSQYIQSKNYAQCRSHHYRMIKRHITVQGIIQKLTRQFSGQRVGGKLGSYNGLRVDVSQAMDWCYTEQHTATSLSQIMLQGPLQPETLQNQQQFLNL